MIRFAIMLVAGALLFTGACYMALNVGWIKTLPTFLYQTLILLVVTTLVIYRYLIRIKQPDFFVQLYLLTIAVKLLAYGAYIAWMIIDDKPGATSNVTVFLIVYFTFTGLEIAFLYRKITR